MPDPALHLPADYLENPRAVYFLDDPKPALHDPSVTVTFQPDVYTLAEWITEQRDAMHPTIVDVGCGWAEKLAGIHERNHFWNLVGVDFGANIEHCREAYDWGVWVEADLESGAPVAVETAALVVCSDVVEHLEDPRPMLRMLRGTAATTFVFSTPDRDVQHGYDHRGPPPNLCHIREWGAGEFDALLVDHGFRVRFHGLTRGSDLGWPMATQIVVAE